MSGRAPVKGNLMPAYMGVPSLPQSPSQVQSDYWECPLIAWDDGEGVNYCKLLEATKPAQTGVFWEAVEEEAKRRSDR